jgi:phosphoglycolate phosphatase
LAALTAGRALPAPRAILFDWDNTLVENWLTVQAALNAALAAAGRAPLDLEQVKLQARHSSRDIFPKLFGNDWERARALFYAHFGLHHLAGLSVMPGAEALLDACREERLPLAVVSNKQGETLRREIAHLGWADRFAGAVGSQDAPADKPDPAPVHLALENLDMIAAPDIWLVGDTDVDMRAAVAAGCSPILIGPGPEDPALLAGVEPALRCHNCRDLAGFLREGRHTISRVNLE